MTLEPAEKAWLEYEWRTWARPNQLPPEGDWRYWLILAGRGFGKTRSGGEWVRDQVAAGYGRIALVGPTAADARDVMVEGESGLMNICPPWDQPRFEPSKRRLTWPNGAMATLYSAEEPERLRGPQHDAAWADELAAWKYLQESWDQLQFGLRLGKNPRCMITTTPKPLPLVRQLVADPDCVVTKGSTYENRANLAQAFVDKIIRRYEGTRLGRQELEAELLEDTPGALWPRALIEEGRLAGPKSKHANGRLPEMARIVIGVDPSGSDGETGDSQGIVAAGLGRDGLGYVLEDGSLKESPDKWARRVAHLYEKHQADRVVAERNFGGAMVEAVLRTAAPNLPVTLVTASRGKVARAEPVAALYEQHRIFHAEPFPELEDQMSLMTSTGFEGVGSPDRLDALVWAITELMLEDNAQGWIDHYRDMASDFEAGQRKNLLPVAANAPVIEPEPEVVLKVELVAPPNVSSLDLSNGRSYPVGAERRVSVRAEDVEMLLRAGCSRLAA